MRVLDAGWGPGRLTLPLAAAVGRAGELFALDIQDAMLERVRSRADRVGATQVRTLRAELGEEFPPAPTLAGRFERALLVTVLGEIHKRPEALQCLYRLLAPDGLLSVTEMAIDPDYVRRTEVVRLAQDAGFVVEEKFGNRLMFAINCRKGTTPRARAMGPV